MLDAKKIEKKYEFWMYVNMIFTLLCFSFAVEKYYLIFPLVGLVTFAYIVNKPITHKMFDIVAFALLVATFRLAYIYGDGDTLYSGGAVLIGTYFLFFFTEKKHRTSPINLLMILGLMLIATFLLDRFQYVFFFLPFLVSGTRLLKYALLYKESLLQPLPVIHCLETNKIPLNFSIKRTVGNFAILVFFIFVAISVFVFIPRSHKWEIRGPKQLNMGRTGFDSEIADGAVKTILSDPNTFFIVETSNTEDYFYGAYYDRYDGSKWYVSPLDKTVYTSGRIMLNSFRQSMRSDTYKFQNSPGNTIFHRKTAVSIQIDTRNIDIIIDAAQNMRMEGNIKKELKYSIVTTPKSNIPQDTMQPEYHQWVKKYYLQLPEDISTRVKNLASRIVQNETDTANKAKNIERYLMSNYIYTLSMSPGKNEISDYFLFEAKKGYCIHFATAMVVMLRSLNIPARVVGGFRSGRYEDNHCIVSNEDAHAWVEVYEPEKGWMFYDPTPAQQDYLIGLDFWRKIYYKMYVFWSHNIVSFSAKHQKEIYVWIHKQVLKIKQQIHWVIIFVIFFYTYKFVRKHKRKSMSGFAKISKKGSSAKERASFITNSFYLKMLHLLLKISITKKETETPGEFVERIREIQPQMHSHVQIITDIFCQTHFGHREFNEQRKVSLEANFTQLQNLVSTSKSKSLRKDK